MKSRYLLSLGALALLLAACADEPIAPTSHAKPALSIVAVNERYIVAFKDATGIPADFVASVEALGGTVVSELSPIGGAIVSGLDASAVAALAGRIDVSAIEADGQLTYRDKTAPESEAVAPADAIASQLQPQTAALFGRQWNMRAVSAPAAWAQGRLGSSAVVAAILDTGIDYTLPDLAGLVDVAHSKSFIPEDDALVLAVFPGKNAITDLDGHGTNVATQVSSKAVYFAGVTSRTTLLGVKVCSLVTAGCPFSAIINGILYATDQGADVINMSLGGAYLQHENGATTSLLNRVFQYAEKGGVTVVVAAGNASADMDHATNVHFTFCEQTHVTCVSAVGSTTSGPSYNGPFDNADQFASYSNFGRSNVDVAAPGGNYTLTPLGTVATAAWVWSLCSRTAMVIQNGTLFYTNCSYPPYVAAGLLFASGYAGTSQASPHVAGLASLLSAEVGNGPAQIRSRIAAGADRVGGANSAYFGAGRINVANTR